MNDVTDIPHWSFFVVYNPTLDKFMVNAGKSEDKRHWCIDWVDDPEQGTFGTYDSPMEFYHQMCSGGWMLLHTSEDIAYGIDDILSWSMVPMWNYGRIEHENAFNVGHEFVGYENALEEGS